MLNGKVAMISVQGETESEVDCLISVVDDFPKDDELHFEIKLIVFSKAKETSYKLPGNEPVSSIMAVYSYFYADSLENEPDCTGSRVGCVMTGLRGEGERTSGDDCRVQTRRLEKGGLRRRSAVQLRL
ncbi:hypothetical protein CASFOL_035806 [Castilleja foliolosa]|uniref:Uncharacterized protein n=1 Tax=Castilleja foliolosa TaxID=1961234 RepID=A0ABD3BUC1_9LAMI